MPSLNRSRVLCVDDDEDACEMLTVLLKAHGMDVVCALSAAEAWLKIKVEHFDLYLLDGWLPRLNGFDFCREIRKSDSITPIVFYSGAAYDIDKQTGMAAGANAYVIKPDLDGLVETMVNLIAKAKADDAASRWVVNQAPPAARSVSPQFFSTENYGELVPAEMKR